MDNDALNAEYACVCKGWKDTHRPGKYNYATVGTPPDGPPTFIPNYLSSDTELGRMVRMLLTYQLLEINPEQDSTAIRIRHNGEVVLDCEFEGCVEKAIMRACIALKVQVPNGLFA